MKNTRKHRRGEREARIGRTMADCDARTAWDHSLINNQRRYPSARGTFGRFGSMSENGCGFLAIHNANQILGETAAFADTYAALQVRACRTTTLFGLFGTNPFAVGRYYRKKGFCVRLYQGAARVSTEHGAYIALYLYREKRALGAHYAAARYDAAARLFTVYNDDFEGEDERHFGDFAAMCNADRALGMLVWGIDRPGV